MTWVFFLLTTNTVTLALLILLIINYRTLDQKNKARINELETLKKDNLTKLSDLSHDLRTPLNAIMGYTSLLSNKIHGDISDKQKQSLERIAKNASRILTIIEDYFSKMTGES